MYVTLSPELLCVYRKGTVSWQTSYQEFYIYLYVCLDIRINLIDIPMNLSSAIFRLACVSIASPGSMICVIADLPETI